MEEAESILKIQTSEYMSSKRENAVRMIAVGSGKGGVGKTNMCVNMGIGLAQLGKEVVIMDADLGMANVNIILGLVPKYNLMDVIQGGYSIQDVMMNTPYGVKIIPGVSGFHEMTQLSKSQKQFFIAEMKKIEQADFILVDLGAGISYNVLHFILSSNEIVIVTTPEPAAITDAYGLIKTIVANQKPVLPIKLIVNRVRSLVEGKKIAHSVSNITRQFLDIKIELLGVVMEDSVVWSSVLQQKPFIWKDPNAKASEDVRDICFALDSNKLTQIQKNGFGSWVKSLVGL